MVVTLLVVFAACGSSDGTEASVEVTASTSTSAVATTTPPTTTATSTATVPIDGREIYLANCASCHGTDGDGGSGGDLIGLTLGVDDVAGIVVSGAGGSMPLFQETLSASEIRAVSQYVLDAF